MVNYANGAAFKAKMAAKLAALDAPAAPPPEPEPEPVAWPPQVNIVPLQWIGGTETTWNSTGSVFNGQHTLYATITPTPPPSVDTDVSTWTLEEKVAAQIFWDTWSVNGKIDCDCPDPMCRRAQALAAAVVPF